MRLYRTTFGLAREEGEGLELLDLPHADVGELIRDGLDRARSARVLRRVGFADVELLPPVAAPRTLVIAGANYLDHVREAGMPTPTAAVFTTATGDQLGDGLLVGPTAPLRLPAEAPDYVDYEAELALVIGLPAKNVAAGEGWRHVAGLMVVNDVSARDVQLAGMTDGVVTDPRQTLRGKTFASFKPMGPALVTPDELAHPLDLAITTKVNGELRQSSRTSEMLFDVPDVLATVTAAVALAPGDIILTGTPAGVALASGRYLRAGDLVEVEIEGIGSLRNEVIAA